MHEERLSFSKKVLTKQTATTLIRMPRLIRVVTLRTHLVSFVMAWLTI